ncbi:hypothetical protein Trco_003651 [Trichoderma cornu-damae]|uniref:DNA polymerase n=1 Tax=Trichoderma cornu-damae TaxID=654480 RepID=A0A9P8QQF4_9HYPO|nr:hypothetical protein Trco_003651 [Trichoderma cornu-damae]
MVSFRVRLNCIDHYQALPSRHDPPLRNDVQAAAPSLKATRVPVIRIFGATDLGQKVCAHVHGVFPYLYVEYEGSLTRDAVGAYIYRLHLSIDHALGISYRRDRDGDKTKYVARITLVKGIPFYGYSVGYKPFLKIYMFNPFVMTRLADLLQQGVIMKRKFQPYEAHLQYLLQFMVDYNLYGCDYVESLQTHFRAPVPEHETGSSFSGFWSSLTVPAAFVTDDVSLPRSSYCSIEVDIGAQHIANRGKVKERLLHHDFAEFLTPQTDDVKLVSSMAGLWKAEARRRQRELPPDQAPGQDLASSFPREALVSMSADPRSSQPPAWIHEEEYRQKVDALIAKEREQCHESDLCLDTFLKPLLREDSIKTALQSVEDLHPSTLMPALGLSARTAQPSEDPSGGIEVDEVKLSQVDDEDVVLATDSDEPDSAQGIGARRSGGGRAGSINPTWRKPAPAASAMKREIAWLKTRVLGIGESGLSTGQLPQIPLSARLVEAALRNQLTFSKDGDGAVAGKGAKAARKRTASWPPSDDGLAKRVKVKHDDVYQEQSLPSSMMEASDPQPESPESTKLPASSHGTADGGTMPKALGRTVTYAVPPPSAADAAWKSDHDLPTVVYRDAFYGNAADVSRRRREYAGREFRLMGNTLPFLPEFDAGGGGFSPARGHDSLDAGPSRERGRMRKENKRLRRHCSWRSWEIAQPPPTYDEVAGWSTRNTAAGTATAGGSWGRPRPSRIEGEDPRPVGQTEGPARFGHRDRPWLSQIEGPTPTAKYDFQYSQRQPSSAAPREAQYMSTMSVEIHVNTRGSFVPNPEQDEIQCIFWHLKDDEAAAGGGGGGGETPGLSRCGILVLSADGGLAGQMRRAAPGDVAGERSELDLLNRLVEVVRAHDPDVLTGYEVHGSSWGYLIERARLKYDYDLCDELSRVRAQPNGRFGREGDRWGFNTTSTIRVTGRHTINIWRAMRGEVNLQQYTMENVVWHLLHRRIPHYSCKSLTAWYRSGKARDLSRVTRYYRTRARLDLEVLESNELISRTSEQARLLGVDFFSVFSRGSQFKVESIMFRIAKPENFMLVSPSRRQVGQQNALECLPLVLEPQSAFYTSPVVVLDFQSLYPSVMIAYNYCYSTFLGRITDWRGRGKMGFAEYRRRDGLLALLGGHINIAPNGMMYAKAEVRKSLLAKMLTEMLETRVMVKSGMKQDRDDRALQRLLNNRQLALKLLANVTYGYTSASFSGRMPCSEIADSIVQTGRETLERAAAHIHSVERWGAEVVYGDTDSLFVHLRGRSRDEAFAIGQEIAEAITERNPRPVKLRFEKVYHPCVLLAKKRYVGYKYESRDQAEPEFDAKGIETVRRDGTPAEQKMEEKALRLLFETADVSRVKDYFRRQCRKVMRGRVSVQDFCFAKEVRVGSYSEQGRAPAGALVSARKMARDARAEPQYGERVPYVVVTGPPGARLTDRCVSPEELLRNPHWQLDADYYITKNLIPPLERIFSLVGASVRQWYDAMPKIRPIHRTKGPGRKKGTLEAYLQPANCLVCARKMLGAAGLPLCRFCCARMPASLLALQTRLAAAERRYDETLRVCRGCEGVGPLEEVGCDSHDCPVFWTRARLETNMLHEQAESKPVIEELNGRMEAKVNGALLDW